jgi:hypothetical protein
MSQCEEFEVAVEMNLHRALNGERAALLVTHLASCASCRSFETFATQTEKEMTTDGIAEGENLDWAAMREQLVERLRKDYRAMLTSQIVPSILVAALWLIVTPNPVWSETLSIAVSWLLSAVWLAVRGRSKQSDVRIHEADKGDFLESYRKNLERRLKTTYSILLMPFVCLGAWHLFVYQRGVPLLGAKSLAMFAIGLISVGLVVRVFTFTQPEIRRQLKSLQK